MKEAADPHAGRELVQRVESQEPGPGAEAAGRVARPRAARAEEHREPRRERPTSAADPGASPEPHTRRRARRRPGSGRRRRGSNSCPRPPRWASRRRRRRGRTAGRPGRAAAHRRRPRPRSPSTSETSRGACEAEPPSESVGRSSKRAKAAPPMAIAWPHRASPRRRTSTNPATATQARRRAPTQSSSTKKIGVPIDARIRNTWALPKAASAMTR